MHDCFGFVASPIPVAADADADAVEIFNMMNDVVNCNDQNIYSTDKPIQ